MSAPCPAATAAHRPERLGLVSATRLATSAPSSAATAACRKTQCASKSTSGRGRPGGRRKSRRPTQTIGRRATASPGTASSTSKRRARSRRPASTAARSSWPRPTRTSTWTSGLVRTTYGILLHGAAGVPRYAGARPSPAHCSTACRASLTSGSWWIPPTLATPPLSMAGAGGGTGLARGLLFAALSETFGRPVVRLLLPTHIALPADEGPSVILGGAEMANAAVRALDPHDGGVVARRSPAPVSAVGSGSCIMPACSVAAAKRCVRPILPRFTMPPSALTSTKAYRRE